MACGQVLESVSVLETGDEEEPEDGNKVLLPPCCPANMAHVR